MNKLDEYLNNKDNPDSPLSKLKPEDVFIIPRDQLVIVQSKHHYYSDLIMPGVIRYIKTAFIEEFTHSEAFRKCVTIDESKENEMSLRLLIVTPRRAN